MNKIETFEDCKNLFKQLTFSLSSLKNFYYGNDKVLVDDSMSKMDYPFLWVESIFPILKPIHPSQVFSGFECQLFVGTKSTSSPQDHETDLDELEGIVREFYIKLLEQVRQEEIEMELDEELVLEDMVFSFADYVVGWGFKLMIRRKAIQLCPNVNLWHETRLFLLDSPVLPGEQNPIQLSINDNEGLVVQWDGGEETKQAALNSLESLIKNQDNGVGVYPNPGGFWLVSEVAGGPVSVGFEGSFYSFTEKTI